ncbi:xanthine dehydrogenase accessory protein XdhC [Acidovorax soli]|uniref:xanthine dehydrogenase accessory protein XdhC n=1 Tax=Acidovorax soli TaxID=592050 RepID=UPI0016135893|nr:xanthine dehydrogenase accessory protein XdhC [Acidovorax soli]
MAGGCNERTAAVENVRLLLAGLAAEPACLVTVESTQGSVPRESGAWMAVFADRLVGTIGGGHLEHQAIAEARRRLAHPGAANDPAPMRFALGPALGQCCGGVVFLEFERVAAQDAPALARRLTADLHPVALFGGGHVGHALARVLAPLPFALTWIDSRDGIFPEAPPPNVHCEHSEPVQMAVPTLAPGSRVLIMSFSHAEDLDVVAACLKRQRERGDLPFIGLIGSKTKWATFTSRLTARDFSPRELAHVTCPIGVPGIPGKEPEVIAVAVAAQLLQSVAAVQAVANPLQGYSQA